MTNMWLPYQSSTTNKDSSNSSAASSATSSPLATNDNNNMYSIVQPPTSNSPSSSNNSSTSEKLDIQNSHQTPLSISSLIPTPSSYNEDEDEQHETSSNQQSEEQYYINQRNTQVPFHYQNVQQHQHYSQHPYQNVATHGGRSSIGSGGSSSSENISLTNSSDISATSSPTYRSPPSSFPASYHHNYQPYHQHQYHHQQQQYHNHIHQQQHPGYQYFNNPYSVIQPKQEIDYQIQRYPSHTMIKSEFDTDCKHLSTSPVLTPTQSATATTSPNYAQAAAAAYYNNMSLNTTNPAYHHSNYNSHQHTHNPYNSLAQTHANAAAMAAAAAAAAAAVVMNNSSAPSNPVNTSNNTISTIKENIAEKSPLSTSNNSNNQFNAYESSSPTSTFASIPHQNLKTNNNPNIKVKLQDMNLWKQFNTIGTEMIITKCGRRMFPSLRVNISGLEATSKYLMVIDIIPVDDNRYKYHNCEWIVSGKAEAHFGGRGYLHPDSPLSGSQWMKQIISFHKLKLTNNPFDRAGHIILNSMHKYVPRLHIIEEGKSISTFIFTDAIFTAVTAYQNESITKLKIEYNPFAKGFRDGQNRKDYRGGKRGSDDENDFQDENSTSNMFSNQMLLASNNAKYSKTNNTSREPSHSLPVVLATKDTNSKYNSNNQHHQLHPHPPPHHHHQQQIFNQGNSYSNLSLNKPTSNEPDSNSLNPNTLLYDF